MVVEVLALTPLLKRPIVFGAVCGLGIGTVGIWLESFWIDAVYHYPWPASMWPEALVMAVPVAVFMGACGALLGLVLTGRPLPRPAAGITAVVLTVLVIAGAVSIGLQTEVPQNGAATINLTDLPSDSGQRKVSADVQVNPRDLISDDPEWVSILSWQGGLKYDRGLVIDRLERLGPGHYRSTRPIPVWGSWTTLLRVQDGKKMAAVPIYLPADPGIGAHELPALASSTRNFVPEITVLQRERNFNHPSWLYSAASVVVLMCTLALIAALAWGAGRINARQLRMGSEAPPRSPLQPRA